MRAIGTGRWLLVIALLALVNVPVAAALLSDRQVATQGVDVTAEVLDTRQQGDEYAVVLRFDADVDPTRRAWPVRVEQAVHDRARDDGTLEVTAVEGEPGAFEAPGEVQSRTGLWMTLLGNVLVAAWVVTMVRRARARQERWDRSDPDDPEGTPGPTGPV